MSSDVHYIILRKKKEKVGPAANTESIRAIHNTVLVSSGSDRFILRGSTVTPTRCDFAAGSHYHIHHHHHTISMLPILDRQTDSMMLICVMKVGLPISRSTVDFDAFM